MYQIMGKVQLKQAEYFMLKFLLVDLAKNCSISPYSPSSNKEYKNIWKNKSPLFKTIFTCPHQTQKYNKTRYIQNNKTIFVKNLWWTSSGLRSTMSITKSCLIPQLDLTTFFDLFRLTKGWSSSIKFFLCFNLRPQRISFN